MRNSRNLWHNAFPQSNIDERPGLDRHDELWPETLLEVLVKTQSDLDALGQKKDG
jgi:hypothetical protein